MREQKRIKRTRYLCCLILSVGLITFFGFRSSPTSAEDYSPVFELFKTCTLMKLDNDGVVLRKECEQLFSTIYTNKPGQSLKEFNLRWERAGGTQALQSQPNKYLLEGDCESWALVSTPTPQSNAWKSVGGCYALTLRNHQVRVRTKITEALTPNFFGFTDENTVKKSLLDAIKTNDRFVLRLVYSQLSDCFSRTHENARFLREIHSKIKYIKTGNARFSNQELLRMYMMGMFRSSDTEMCNRLDKVITKTRPSMVRILKAYIEHTSVEKQKCLSIKELLNKYNSFSPTTHPSICKELYVTNMKRILEVALRVLDESKREQEEKQKTSSEQLIK